MSSNQIPAISIVMPVYKAEKYICKCIDSILGQTFKDFELILVDDGSPDNSGLICDEYAKRDKRVIVIHKKNGGVANARQIGINKATGEYTIHADPDDWMELDMLESMYNTIQETNSDLLITDFYLKKNNRESYCKQLIQDLSQENVLKEIITNIHGGLWNKLLRTSIYKHNQIRFIDGINIFEDVLFWLQVLQINNLKISYLPKAFYHYDTSSNNNSLTRSGNKKLADGIEKYLYNIEILIPDKYQKERETAMLNTLAYTFFSGIHLKRYKYYYKKSKKTFKTYTWI